MHTVTKTLLPAGDIIGTLCTPKNADWLLNHFQQVFSQGSSRVADEVQKDIHSPFLATAVSIHESCMPHQLNQHRKQRCRQVKKKSHDTWEMVQTAS